MLIKKARFKNKLILWGIVALLVISVSFILYMALAPDSSEVIVPDTAQNNMSATEEMPLNEVPTPLANDSIDLNETAMSAETTMEGGGLGEDEVGQEGLAGEGGGD